VALGFVPHLAELLPTYLLHEGCPDSFIDGKLTPTEAASYRRLQRTDKQRSAAATKNSIAIEHGAACLARTFTAARRPRYVIARAMTEGALARDQASCMISRGFDEYWVPTDYHVKVFTEAGIARSKILVVPEPVDTAFFDPLQVPAVEVQGWRASAAVAAATATKATAGSAGAAPQQPFTFCSVFKWESRKGWDTLISAYWAEFKMPTTSTGQAAGGARANTPVLLRLRSYVPHWEAGPRQIRIWLEQHAKRKYPHLTLSDLPPIEVFEQELSRAELRALYASSDAFALPTKGEGWVSLSGAINRHAAASF
jgi:glycosyltransferase involved in cell wall biosynthesis